MTRSGLLTAYEEAWGEPVEVMRVHHDTSPSQFWVLSFEPPGRVARVVTLDLSRCFTDDEKLFGVELVFALGKLELNQIGWERVAHFLVDISVSLLRRSHHPAEGSTIAGSPLAPWEPHAMVFSRPHGEPEHMERITTEGVAVRLMWAIPAYPEEVDVVKRSGIEALFALEDAGEYSLADITRPSLVRP